MDINFDNPPSLESGIENISYTWALMDLRQEITELLIAKGFLDRKIPLEELHLNVGRKSQVNDHLFLNGVTNAFYTTSDKCIYIYHRIIKYISWLRM